MVIADILLRADVVDRNGDKFTKGCLKEAAQACASKVDEGMMLAYKGFRSELANAQGRVTELYACDAGIYASVELLDTPEGKKVQECLGPLALAAGGQVDLKDTEVSEVDGKKVRTINRFELTSVSVVPRSDKVE